jgi:hypothetical protein
MWTQHIAYFRYASITACPSAPAFMSHSPVRRSPICCSPDFNARLGGNTFMPLVTSCSMYHLVLSCDLHHPRASAAAATLSIVSCVGLSSWSNAALFMKVTFFGSQAWVS